MASRSSVRLYERVSLAALAALANPYGYPVERPLTDAADVLAELATPPPAHFGTLQPVFEAKGFFGAGQQLYGSGVHAAIVEVEPSTGAVHIMKYVLVHDCGVMVNPAIVSGQVLGGLVQGIGGALLERLPFDAAGQPQATSFMNFLLPAVDNVPEIVLDHVETPSPLNPLGVKGTGEAGVIPVSAVIAEAVEGRAGSIRGHGDLHAFDAVRHHTTSPRATGRFQGHLAECSEAAASLCKTTEGGELIGCHGVAHPVERPGAKFGLRIRSNVDVSLLRTWSVKYWVNHDTDSGTRRFVGRRMTLVLWSPSGQLISRQRCRNRGGSGIG